MKKIIICLCCGLLAACSLGPVSQPQMTMYQLGMLPTLIPKMTNQQRTLVISAPIAEPAYATNGIAYTNKKHQINYYATHHFIASPAQLILPKMIVTLAKTNRFKAVVAAPYIGVGQLQLDTRIMKLEADFIQNRPQLVLQIQCDLINLSRARIMRSTIFNIVEPISEQSPAAVVDAANLATQQFLERLIKFVI